MLKYNLRIKENEILAINILNGKNKYEKPHFMMTNK